MALLLGPLPGQLNVTWAQARAAIDGRAAIFLTFPLILAVVEDLISGPWVCGLAPVFQDRAL